MHESFGGSRAKVALAGAAAAAALALIWWGVARNVTDDPAALLRKASAAESGPVGRLTGKKIAAGGQTESGSPVKATMVEVVGKDGEKGFILSMPEPLKEGEAATVKLPKGGSLEIALPKEGQRIGPAEARAKGGAR